MKTKQIQYTTTGTCSRCINITADDNNIIQQVEFVGGCPGNTIGVARLAQTKDFFDKMLASIIKKYYFCMQFHNTGYQFALKQHKTTHNN